MCPWEQIQRKSVFSKQFNISILPTSPARRNSNLGEGFSAKLSKMHSTCSEERFQENLFCFGKIYIFINFGNWSKSNSNLFENTPKLFLHWILFVEWNVISEVFISERKNISIISFRILTDKITKRKLIFSTGFPELYSTCPEDFN